MLFCIIDGISYCEGNEFDADTLITVRCLLALVTGSASTKSALKLLVASPWATDRVRNLFRDSRVVSLAGIGPVGDADALLSGGMAKLGLRSSSDSSDQDDDDEVDLSESEND